MENNSKDVTNLSEVLKYIILAILVIMLISIINLILILTVLVQLVLEIYLPIILVLSLFGGIALGLLACVVTFDVVDKYLKKSNLSK